MRCFQMLVASGTIGFIGSGCSGSLSANEVNNAASLNEVEAAIPKELNGRQTVIIRIPFDESGKAKPDKAELRVAGQVVAGRLGKDLVIHDFTTAEQAWDQAIEPADLFSEGQPEEKKIVASAVQPTGYYTWNRGFPPSYFSNGFRWGYGLPGFYFGWGSGNAGGFSVGYGPASGWGYPPGYGYAGGFAGWYGHPLYYGMPYSSWYRPGFGYYYYPRHLGSWSRPW
jgi:hypothetical protein